MGNDKEFRLCPTCGREMPQPRQETECPLCGHTQAELWVDGDHCRMQCSFCGSPGPAGLSPEEADRKWRNWGEWIRLHPKRAVPADMVTSNDFPPELDSACGP